MPFQSEAQRRYLWANEPKIARDWADTYGSRIEKNDGGIMRTGFFTAGLAQGDNISPGTSSSGGMRHGPGNIHGGPTVKEALKVGKEKKALRDLALRTAEDKREEKVERFRNKKVMNKRTRDFFLDKNLQQKQFMKNLLKGRDFYDLELSEQEDIYGQYMKARGAGTIDAYADILGGGGGDGSYYPQNIHPGTGTEQITTEVVEPISDFQKSLTGTVDTPNYYVGGDPTASNLEWGQAYGVDPRTMGQTSWAANGGRIPRAFGGIMDSSTGRRAYGFGSIGKIFGKVAKAAKKVFKSPIGRAALIGGLGFGANAGWFSKMGLGNMGKGWVGGLKEAAQNKDWLGKLLLNKDENFSPWKLGIAGLTAAPFLMGDQEEDEGSKFDYLAAKNAYADELRRIKSGAMAGSLDPNEFSYLGVKDGGRIGLYSGGQSTPSDYTMEDARKTSMQDKMGGITETMKRADLYRQGDVGQMYAAHGGRIGAEEGGLMDLGGMEKDYRNEGGFVPLGGEEKADDVPARLSKNEFVFTADAVRGAGDGDIDKGAEIMENIMKNLEQGGQISKETQGLSGAQEMFGVSERLSEVV
jgi:hypothetical protein